MTGTIKKVVADRGFGFITDEKGNDYFFHRDSLTEPLRFESVDASLQLFETLREQLQLFVIHDLSHGPCESL